MNKPEIVGVVGCGTMGSGIALLAAQNGHLVYAFDSNPQTLMKAKANNQTQLKKLMEKSKITEQQAEQIGSNLIYSSNLADVSPCHFVIEAIVENLDSKKSLFKQLEQICPNTILATNTSSLSVASVAAACQDSSKVIGIHFFNPAPVMPLVEIIPAIQTSEQTLIKAENLIASWSKTIVRAKDTPGFIVNRVARPFYGEALRIYDEGIADFATIDWAVKTFGGFKMGPFELMDFIGLDVNYAVSETVFKEMYFDPRYKPSTTQKRLVEAGYWGRKTARGFYDYKQPASQPLQNEALGIEILNRILCMLINEAAEAAFLHVATPHDIDMAMVKGTSYPKGLLAWAEEIGISVVLTRLEKLQADYGEDRYRPSYLLKKLVGEQKGFFDTK